MKIDDVEIPGTEHLLPAGGVSTGYFCTHEKMYLTDAQMERILYKGKVYAACPHCIKRITQGCEEDAVEAPDIPPSLRDDDYDKPFRAGGVEYSSYKHYLAAMSRDFPDRAPQLKPTTIKILQPARPKLLLPDASGSFGLVAPEPVKLICFACSRFFVDRDHLVTHRHTHHNSKLFCNVTPCHEDAEKQACVICDVYFCEEHMSRKWPGVCLGCEVDDEAMGRADA